MKIIIIGAGKVGHKLVQQLSQDDHDIFVIDIDNEAIKDLANTTDIQPIHGNAVDLDIQNEVGVDDADLVIACTDSDELNMLCCFLYKHRGAKQTIARIRRPEYSEQMSSLKDELGLSMYINPELTAAEVISRLLLFPAANIIETFAKGKVELIEFTVEEGNPLVGLSLAKIHHKFNNNVLICAVQSGEDVFIPDGKTILKRGDKAYVASNHQNIHDFFKEIKIIKDPVKSVLIVGASKVTYYLAKQLMEHGVGVLVLEQNKDKCTELSDRIPGLEVRTGDGTDREVLEDEGIGNVDAFVSLTGIDEINIILALYARSRDVRKVIPKVTQVDFYDMLNDLGIESPISPKDITANDILRYVRAIQNSKERDDGGSTVESLCFLVGGRVEALEFHVRGHHDFVDIPLRDLDITKGCLIANIVRGNKVIIPGGSDVVKIHDELIVVTTNTQIRTLNDVLRLKL